MKSKDITALLKIGEAGLAASQSRFSAITRKEMSIRSQIAELDTSRTKQPNLPGQELGAEKFVGADLLWSKWIEARKRVLNEALALVLSQKINAQADLKKAFGRKEALRQISSKTAAAQHIKQKRERY